MLSRMKFGTTPERLVYGLSHLLAGFTMLLSVGFFHVDIVHRTSLWIARRDLKRRNSR